MALYITERFKFAVAVGPQGTYDILAVDRVRPERYWAVVNNRDWKAAAVDLADKLDREAP